MIPFCHCFCPNHLFRSFRVTEQPFKIPYYAALVRILHEDTMDSDSPSIGRPLLEDFWKGFQAYLDKLAWRETRLCVRPCSPPSFPHFTFFSFTAVLDEFGVSHGRAKRAAFCAGEALMIVRVAPQYLKPALIGNVVWLYPQSTLAHECHGNCQRNPDLQ